jgi:glycosyltransferase involved in cell wall biosynthesis
LNGLLAVWISTQTRARHIPPAEKRQGATLQNYYGVLTERRIRCYLLSTLFYRLQKAAYLALSMRVISCNSPYGQGGVGQHFAQLVEESREEGLLDRYYAPDPKPGDQAGTRIEKKRWHDWVVQYTPIRFSRGWRSYLRNEFFDIQVARILDSPLQRFMGFVGTSLRSFRRASDLDAKTLELVAANSHVRNLKRKHEQAKRRHGIGDSWLNDAQMRKTLREYEMADTIYVHSDYTHQSFLDAGVPGEKLKRTYLHVDPRFHPPDRRRPDNDPFRIAYVGRVESTKGIPLLLEAFSELSIDNKQLTLVGGWSTRSMRKYMEPWLADDHIRMAPGDPLPVLHQADAFVHPTYEDGFGYAPMEALACGVPVIATEDTGMKEYVREDETGYVVPTGRVSPIVDRLERLQQDPMATTTSLLPPWYEDERASPPMGEPVAHDADF